MPLILKDPTLQRNRGVNRRLDGIIVDVDTDLGVTRVVTLSSVRELTVPLDHVLRIADHCAVLQEVSHNLNLISLVVNLPCLAHGECDCIRRTRDDLDGYNGRRRAGRTL